MTWPGKPSARLTLRTALHRAHLVVALIAVSMAGISLTAAGLLALRAYADHNLQLIARSISYTAEAAVVFRDARATSEALALIASAEDLEDAEVFDREGKLLASWHRPTIGPIHSLEQQLSPYLMPPPIVLPIVREGVEMGRIRVAGNGASLLSFLLSGLAGMLACLIISAISAIYLSRRMLGGIVSPLRYMTRVAHAIRSERAFDQRVPPAEIAELNELSEDFNALLDELESWRAHLQRENTSLAHQASHDSLTGLPNRSAFKERLIRAMRDAGPSDHIAVLFMDCDHFKDINDSLGHAAGDVVLENLASRAQEQLRETDLVARLGGDEFAVLLSPVRDAESAVRIAEKILASMNDLIVLPAGNQVAAALSIGIALFPDHARDPDALINAADAAMYRAKQSNRGGWQIAGPDDAALSQKPQENPIAPSLSQYG